VAVPIRSSGIVSGIEGDAAMRKRSAFRPILNERLEDRAVPSGFSGMMSHVQVLSMPGGQGMGGGMMVGTEPGSYHGSMSTTVGSMMTSGMLASDSRTIQQAFQNLGTSMSSALAALRMTGTATTPPTGHAAYDAAVDTAIGKLTATMTGMMPNTGAAVASKMGMTTLQTDLKSIGAHMANGSMQAMRLAQQQMNGEIRTAMNHAMMAIRTDQPAGSITPATIQTYNQAVRAAVQTFNTAINAAAQPSIASGTKLDGAAVGSAVQALQTSLTATIAGLDTPTLLFDPTTDLATLQSRLTGIAAPTTGKSASARLFVMSINMAVGQTLMQINQFVGTAIAAYNASLL
jgi:hypothetical protein